MYRNILIPTDGTVLSEAALVHGLKLAKEAGAKVTVVTVIEPFHVLSTSSAQISATRMGYHEHVKAEAERYLSEAQIKAKALGVSCDVVQVEHYHPYQAIIDTAAKKECDLIAMASHGRRGVSALVIGSETLKVLTHSATPVLVYR